MRVTVIAVSFVSHKPVCQHRMHSVGTPAYHTVASDVVITKSSMDVAIITSPCDVVVYVGLPIPA